MDITPETSLDPDRELKLLEQIESDPDVSQATLADQLGVAVGTVNWHLKRLIAKGYVKVKKLQRRKLRYLITPEGIAFRARLTIHYIETSMRLYHRVREQVMEQLESVQNAGYSHVVVQGDGDIADICRLTCLEKGIMTIETRTDEKISIQEDHLPILEIRGTKVFLNMEPKKL